MPFQKSDVIAGTLKGICSYAAGFSLTDTGNFYILSFDELKK
jgi:hypothetical protein